MREGADGGNGNFEDEIESDGAFEDGMKPMVLSKVRLRTMATFELRLNIIAYSKIRLRTMAMSPFGLKRILNGRM
jgi:hypothetical protein